MLQVFRRTGASKPTNSGEEAYQGPRDAIYGDPLLSALPAAEQQRAAAQTMELYAKSREVVAPVIAGFADHLLDEADGRKIVCAARDGLATYLAAKKLQDSFEYPGSSPDQLSYAFLTRRVVFGAGRVAVGQHLEQLGIEPKDDVLLADIGMYGTFISEMRRILPKLDVHYLISRASNIPGYADGPREHRMASMATIVGNPAVHFLEDTFSGPIPSPADLVEADGMIVPNTLGQTYPPEIALRRKYALAAIEDYAGSLSERPTQPGLEAIARLDEFLLDRAGYTHLAVPHER